MEGFASVRNHVWARRCIRRTWKRITYGKVEHPLLLQPLASLHPDGQAHLLLSVLHSTRWLWALPVLACLQRPRVQLAQGHF